MCSLVMRAFAHVTLLQYSSRLIGLTCSTAPGLWMVEHQLVVFSQHNNHIIENFWQVKY